MKVRLKDIILKNPVIPASGTCGFGVEMSEWMDLNILGAISIKGRRGRRAREMHVRVLLNAEQREC